MNWSVYNQSLVRRGEILIGFDVMDNWDVELKDMNKDKIGEPSHYPNSFLLLLGYAKVYFHLPFRQTEGIAQEDMLKEKYFLFLITVTINRRIYKLDINVENYDKSNEIKGRYIVIATDSTSIKVTNIGLSGLEITGM